MNENDTLQLMKKTKDKKTFIKVECPRCRHKQITSWYASTQVRCFICDESLTEPYGGKAKIKGKIIEVFGNTVEVKNKRKEIEKHGINKSP